MGLYLIKYNFSKNQLEKTLDSGYKNLLVNGCSFTSNLLNPVDGQKFALTWPAFLRSRINIDNYYDCSLPGAGNYHIFSSTIWAIENTKSFNKDNTFIAIMWSGNDRDDDIVDNQHVQKYSWKHNYSKNVSSGLTGGSNQTATSNIKKCNWEIKQFKSKQSRAIENYIYIQSLYSYLKEKQFNFIFLDYMSDEREIPFISEDFSILKYLPEYASENLKNMVQYNCKDIYSYCFENDLLSEDLYHPGTTGHLEWTDNVLIPFLIENNYFSSRHYE